MIRLAELCNEKRESVSAFTCPAVLLSKTFLFLCILCWKITSLSLEMGCSSSLRICHLALEAHLLTRSKT